MKIKNNKERSGAGSLFQQGERTSWTDQRQPAGLGGTWAPRMPWAGVALGGSGSGTWVLAGPWSQSRGNSCSQAGGGRARSGDPGPGDGRTCAPRAVAARARLVQVPAGSMVPSCGTYRVP